MQNRRYLDLPNLMVGKFLTAVNPNGQITLEVYCRWPGSNPRQHMCPLTMTTVRGPSQHTCYKRCGRVFFKSAHCFFYREHFTYLDHRHKASLFSYPQYTIHRHKLMPVIWTNIVKNRWNIFKLWIVNKLRPKSWNGTVFNYAQSVNNTIYLTSIFYHEFNLLI